MLLTEQIIKRIGRVYWRGSEFKSWDQEKSEYSCLYISADIVYALAYSHLNSSNVEDSKYLTQYCLNSQINLFNAKSKKDYQKLGDYCRIHKNYQKFLLVLVKLKSYDWYNDVLGFESREQIIQALKEMNYDGFVNIESEGNVYKQNKPKKVSDTTLYSFDGIGIFDEKVLTKVKVYFGWEKIKQLSEVKSVREAAKSIIIRYLYSLKKFKLNQDLLEELNNLTIMVFTIKELIDIVSSFSYKVIDNKVQNLREFLKKEHRPIFFAERYI